MPSRKLPALLLLMLSALICGCQLAPSTSTDFNQAIVQNEGDIRLFASTATTVALLNTPVAKRTNTAREIFQIAATVNSTVQTASPADPVSIAQVNSLIQELVAQTDLPDAQIGGVILNSISGYITTELKTKFTNAPADSQTQMLQVLLRGASNGVMDAASAYTNGTPVLATTTPALKVAEPSRTRFNWHQQPSWK